MASPSNIFELDMAEAEIRMMQYMRGDGEPPIQLTVKQLYAYLKEAWDEDSELESFVCETKGSTHTKNPSSLHCSCTLPPMWDAHRSAFNPYSYDNHLLAVQAGNYYNGNRTSQYR